jgi:hypothetical protein
MDPVTSASLIALGAFVVVGVVKSRNETRLELAHSSDVSKWPKTVVNPLTGIIELASDRTASAVLIAQKAGVDKDVYAVARAIASEGIDRFPDAAFVGIAFAILNRAAELKKSPFELLTDDPSTFGSANGLPNGKGVFGLQFRRGRYASTDKDPNQRHADIAALVVSRSIADPTGGAVQWDSPRSQGAQPGTLLTADQVAEERKKDGKEMVVLPGMRAFDLRFWRVA